MKEYIEQAVAIERARNELDLINKSHWSADEIVDFLKRLPAADVAEVIHAHWVKPTKIGWRSVDVPHCSYCKEIPCGVDMNTHYCPNCGAKMDGGMDE